MQCPFFLRSYSTTHIPVTPSYSHLARTVFHPHSKEGPGGWRDTPEEYADITRIVGDISTLASKSMKSSKSNIVSILHNPKTGGLFSASNWPSILPPGHLRIYWQPTNDVDLVLPKECEPSDKDMERYESLLKPEYDRDFFLDVSRWQFGNTYEDAVARALHRLLYSGKRSQTINMEDKIELYTVDFFSILRDYVRMEDLQTRKFTILRGENITGKIFGNKYNAKPEFALQDERGSLQAFIENKRLRNATPDMYTASISQKTAEALAIATTRYFASGTAGKSQEVFGIGIRHYYFTFWHAYLSSEYLASITVGQQWQGDEHVIFKSHPYSQFGLDFTDPKQRRDILRYIHRILNYLRIQ